LNLKEVVALDKSLAVAHKHLNYLNLLAATAALNCNLLEEGGEAHKHSTTARCFDSRAVEVRKRLIVFDYNYSHLPAEEVAVHN
jgi:hypothetical protein